MRILDFGLQIEISDIRQIFNPKSEIYIPKFFNSSTPVAMPLIYLDNPFPESAP